MVGYYSYGKNQYKILVVVNSIINRRDVIFDAIPQEVGQVILKLKKSSKIRMRKLRKLQK